MAYIDEHGVEFSDDRKTLVKCPEDFEGEYVIPEGVVDIEVGAFKNCNSLSGITIPNSVWMIAGGSFENCNGLTSIYIPSNVGCIGIGVFAGCNSLNSIVVDRNNRVYDSRDNCNAIIMTHFHTLIAGCKNTALPLSVRMIDGYAFANLSELYSIDILNSSIDASAFEGCNNLTIVTIGRNVTSISAGAFKGCNNLKSIVVKNNQVYDSRNNCNAIIETKSNTLVCGCNNSTIPNSVLSIGYNAFSECKGLISVNIPNSVTCIGEEAFVGCTDLKFVMIPNSVTSIGNNAFQFCTSLASVTIPHGVINIGEGAFFGCTDLRTVTIPNSVKSIGYAAFGYCKHLEDICIPVGQEDFFCQMEGLEDYADIIRQISEEGQQRETREQELLQAQQLQELLQGSTLFFDTETTGVPKRYNAPVSDYDNWPRLVQLAWLMTDKDGKVLKQKSVIIKPDGFTIPQNATDIHGITTERAQREGIPLADVLEEFETDLSFAERIVGHNVEYDQRIVGAELYRLNMDSNALMDKPSTCTKLSSTDYCALPNPNPELGRYKWPSLQELYQKLFNRSFEDAHDALADITATKECYFELKHQGII